MAEKKVIGGLSWVKGEISATLRPVRDLAVLYGAASGPSDATDALAALEQVHGVLLALQLSVPARLLEEMRQLTERLSQGQLAEPQEAASTLTQSLLDLSGHLDRLDSGEEHPALALCPTINALRTSCGETPLTQTELLAFAAFPETQELQQHPEQLARFSSILQRVRGQFHRHLLDWYRNGTEGPALAHLTDLFSKVRQLFGNSLLGDVFELATQFTSALRTGQLDNTEATHALMGRFDGVFKPLIQQPPQWPQGSVFALIDLLLHALSTIDPAPETLRTLRERYTTPTSLEGPSSELLERARTVLEEFTHLEEMLERFAQSDQRDKTLLADIDTALHHAMDQLDIGADTDLVTRLQRLIGDLASLGLVAGDDLRIESLATEFLAIKAQLQHLVARRNATPENQVVTGIDLGELTATTLREAGYELIQIRENIARYHTEHAGPEPLQPVPAALSNVAGALQILGEERAANLAMLTADLVRERYLEQNQFPDSAEFDQLADAIAALELHINQLQDGQPFGFDLLGRAHEALNALRGVEEPIAPPDTAHEPDSAPAPEPHLELPASAPEEPAPTAAPESDAPESAAQATPETLPRLDLDPELAGTAPAPAIDESTSEPQPPSLTLDVLPGVDSGESQAAQAPREPALELELPPTLAPDAAPSLEITETEPTSGSSAELPSLDLPPDAAPADALPSLQRETAPASTPLSEAAPLEPPSEPVSTPAPTETATPSAPAETASALMDPEFVEVFLEESGEEIEAAKASFARWSGDSGDREALTRLRRCFHTLKGSGRLIGAQQVGEVAWRVEDLLNQVIEERLAQSPALCAFVEQVIAEMPALVETDTTGGTWPVAEAVARAERIATGETALEQHAAPEPEPEQPDTQTAAATLDVASDLTPEASEMLDPGQLFDEDSELLDIFQGEAEEHLEQVQIWLEQAGENQIVDEPLIRALHTLAGSARMAGVETIGALAKRLEQRFEPLRAARSPLNDAERQRLGAALDAISARLAELPLSGKAAKTLAAQARDLDAADTAQLMPPPPELPDAEESEPPPIAAPLPLEDPLAGKISTEPRIDIATTPIAPVADESGELANELAGLFLEDARELRDTLDADFNAWQNAPGETDRIDAINRALHTLKGSARLAGLAPVGDLAHALESCLKTLHDAPEHITPASVALAQRALDSIASQIDALEAGDAPAPMDALIAELDHAASTQTPEPSAPGSVAEDTPAPPAPEPEPEQVPSTSGLDPELVSLFMEDARELLNQLDAQFDAWHQKQHDPERIDTINRALHTLKGSARLAGLGPIGDLTHALETRLKSLHDDPEHIDLPALALAQRALDAIASQVDAVEANAPLPALGTLLADLGETTAPDAPVSTPAPAPAPDRVTPPTPAPEPAQTAASAPAEGASQQIRVRAELLNQLVDNAGEISIYRARLSQRNNQLGFNLGELDQTLARLHNKLRQLEIEAQTQLQQRSNAVSPTQERSEASRKTTLIRQLENSADTDADATDEEQSEEALTFDALEFDRYTSLQQLSNSLAETVDDLSSVKDLLLGYQREVTDLLTQQARLADELQDGLLRTRLVPFAQVVPRLQRLVRQTAASVGKSAQLEVIGSGVALDRAVLDRLVGPLEHLLRNGVDHGLEDPATRAERGKPSMGTLTLSLHREGNDAIISLTDDGKGLDTEAIRAKAVERGMLIPGAQIPDEALLQFVLEPGFTTRSQVTQISGRGVGLDVVSSEIKASNGMIELASTPGLGAIFTIRLPLTLAMIEAFLVQIGETIYAIPHNSIEAVERIPKEDLVAIYDHPERTFEYLNRRYRVVYLGGVLDGHQQPQFGERRHLPLLLARLGEQRVALQVDNLIETQRILVKPLGPQLADVRWLSGGTILPDGRVALILDALALLRSTALQEYRPQHSDKTEQSDTLCVMVVDDSLTVRRVTSRLLRRLGMEVMTAKDGVEALTLFDERLPDVVLLDIEMPRMDGYELTRHIRRSEQLHDLPIIMITSRTGSKHRDHALELGVNRYLGKPYQEAQLLEEIQLVLGDRPQ